MTAGQRERVESAIRLLTLIEGNADSTSYLNSMESIDRRRVAMRDAARAARRELELGFGMLWLPTIGGPRRRDGSTIDAPRQRSR
jgi:hypothetical protein